MNHSDRAILYLIAALAMKPAGAAEWCVTLTAITSCVYAARAVAGFVWRGKEGGGK
jgi:hypothetical protein